MPFELLRQRPVAVVEHDPGNGLKQNTIVLGNLLHRAHENATRLVDTVNVDERNEPSLQLRPAICAAIGEHHHVHGDSGQAPVCVGPNQLARQVKIVGITRQQRDDRQVAGDRVAPQARLALRVSGENGRLRTQRREGDEHCGGQIGIAARILGACLQLIENGLGVCCRGVDQEVCHAPVPVLSYQLVAALARVADTADQIHRRGLAGLENHAAPDGCHRVENRARAARQWKCVVQRLRIGRAAPATDESRPIRLVRQRIGW